MSELTAEMLKDEVFYSPTRKEPYSVTRNKVDRSKGILAARAYLETKPLHFNRLILNCLARIMNWVAK